MAPPRSKREEELIASAARTFPGGVLGRHKLDEDHALVFSHGRGGHVFDCSGREYIDYTCGGGALLLGYDHTGVLEAVRAQVSKATNFISILNAPAVEYARELLEVLPCGGLIRFCSSGAEGTFYAMRLARAYTGRDKILKFEGAYHGHHDLAMWSYNTKQLATYPDPVQNTGGIARGMSAYVLIAPYNDLDTTESIIRSHAKDLACVILEPVQRLVGVKRDFLAGLARICREYGVILIFDETVTGFRLALGGAQQYFGKIPDLAVYGKTLGGGLPMAAVAGRPEIMQLCDPSVWQAAPNGVFFSGTLSGNPLAAAAGRAFLAALRTPNVYPPFLARAEALKAGLREIIQRRHLDAQVIGEGPMWHVVFTRASISDYRSSLTGDSARLLRFHYALIDNGIFVRPGGGHYFSMAHTDQDVEKTLSIVDGILGRLN